MSLAVGRYLDEAYSPQRVAATCGVPAQTIERIALEMAQVAFHEAIELPIRWTDVYGRSHDTVAKYLTDRLPLILAANSTDAAYEGEGHGWGRPETVIDELERTESFLRRHVLRCLRPTERDAPQERARPRVTERARHHERVDSPGGP